MCLQGLLQYFLLGRLDPPKSEPKEEYVTLGVALQRSMPATKDACCTMNAASLSPPEAGIQDQGPPANASLRLKGVNNNAHAHKPALAACFSSSEVGADAPLQQAASQSHEQYEGVHAPSGVEKIVEAEQTHPTKPVPASNPDVIVVSSDDESEGKEIRGTNMSEQCPAVSAAENGSNDVVVQQDRQQGISQTGLPDVPGQERRLQSTPMTKLRSRKTTKTPLLGAAS